MGKHTVIAVDIAKSVFEIAESEEPGRVSRRRRVTRAQFLRVFTNREPVEVVMEACSSAHHRRLSARTATTVFGNCELWTAAGRAGGRSSQLAGEPMHGIEPELAILVPR